MDQPSYLQSLQANVRQRPIAWDGAVRTGAVSADHLDLIRTVDKVRVDVRRSALVDNLDAFRDMFLGIGSKPSVFEAAQNRLDVVQYLLVLLTDLVEALLEKEKFNPFRFLLELIGRQAISSNADASSSAAVTANDASDATIVAPAPPSFISNSQMDPMPLLAAVAAVAIMHHSRHDPMAAANPATADARPTLFAFLSALAGPYPTALDPSLPLSAVTLFADMLSLGPSARAQFWAQRSQTVDSIMGLLKSAADALCANGSSSLFGYRSMARAGDSSSIPPPGAGVADGSSSSAAAVSAMAAATAAGVTSVRGFDVSSAAGISIQLLYKALLVMWLMTFDADKIGVALHRSYDIVHLYTDLLRNSPKEKTTRLLVSSLFNLLDRNRGSLLATATLARLPSLVDTLHRRQPADQELMEDLTSLKTLLAEHAATVTTYDEYVAELRSGRLRWTPPHRNDMFWRDNARRIATEGAVGSTGAVRNAGPLVRRLAEILANPRAAAAGDANAGHENTVLAVACNDIGCLVRELPDQHVALGNLGLKTQLMKLMERASDDTVKWESLRAVGSFLKYSVEPSGK